MTDRADVRLPSFRYQGYLSRMGDAWAWKDAAVLDSAYDALRLAGFCAGDAR